MLKNNKGTVIRNPAAKCRWQVPMHAGRKHFTVEVPADGEREAILIAENETKFAVWTGTPCKQIA